MYRLTIEEIRDARIKFSEQKKTARRRFDKNNEPIQFELSFEEWIQIWLDSGHWYERGCGKNQYCMARKGDIGPYSIDNIEIIPTSQNKSDGMKGGNSTSFKKGNVPSDYNKQRVSETSKNRHNENRIKKYIEYLESEGYTIIKTQS